MNRSTFEGRLSCLRTGPPVRIGCGGVFRVAGRRVKTQDHLPSNTQNQTQIPPSGSNLPSSVLISPAKPPQTSFNGQKPSISPPSSPRTPHFPALRSGPTAGSGATRQKQIPSNKSGFISTQFPWHSNPEFDAQLVIDALLRAPRSPSETA